MVCPTSWVFVDPRVGLSQEPFVSGIPEMIDTMVANIPNAEEIKGVGNVCSAPRPRGEYCLHRSGIN